MKKKKILLTIVVLLVGVMLCGCGKKEEKSLDLDKIRESIASLENDKFDRLRAVELINSEVENLTDVYDFDFKKTFGFTATNILDYSVGRNSKTKEVYFIVEPDLEKEDAVKKDIETYLKKNKLKYEFAKIDNYLVYLATNNDNIVLLEEVKKCHQKVFGDLMNLNNEELEQQLAINSNDVSAYLVEVPTFITQSSTIAIVKPNKDKKDEVKDALEAYFDRLEEQWQAYLPDQYELVKNRLVKEYEGYYIYIVSDDNDTVWNLISNN